MKNSLALLLLLVPGPDGEEPELPPVRKVTLRLENIPAVEAVTRFSRAAGCRMDFYKGRHGWGVEQDDEAKAMTLDLKDIPFFEAVDRFCRAHGNFSYSFGERLQIVLHGQPSKNPPVLQQGRFLFWTEGVAEEVKSDFSSTERSCTVELSVAWQPDLRVVSHGPVTVSSVRDDRGRELVAAPPPAPEPGEFRDWNNRGPIERALRVPLAPRGARSISIRGTIALRVPRRIVAVELPFHGDLKPVRAGWVTIESSVKGQGEERTWRFVVRSDGGKLVPDQILDLRNSCENEYEYWNGWGKWGSIRGLEDGSVEMTVTGRDESVECFRFKVIEGLCTLNAPFELKDVVLPR